MTRPPTQNFYQQISSNQRRSWLLVVLVTAFLVALGFIIGYLITGALEGGYFAIGIAVAIALLMSAFSYFGGDSLVLAESGAHEVNDQSAPQLMNVVRELSLAANIPPPRVYVINDPAPNAFATGRDPQHASVAVTAGLLEKMDREELQGVIGHELSHVRNYDIRFSLLVAVLVGSIVLLADFFLRFTFWGGLGGGRGRDRRSGGGEGGGGLFVILLVVGLILAIIAPIFAALVQMAVSRQREYLADASSVDLTRNPYGLESALVKIGEDTHSLSAANRATQHLYFVNPLKKMGLNMSNLMATHPPIVERINRLRRLTGQPPIDQQTTAALGSAD
jgi:heat shock protein HtpX